ASMTSPEHGAQHECKRSFFVPLGNSSFSRWYGELMRSPARRARTHRIPQGEGGASRVAPPPSYLRAFGAIVSPARAYFVTKIRASRAEIDAFGPETDAPVTSSSSAAAGNPPMFAACSPRLIATY